MPYLMSLYVAFISALAGAGHAELRSFAAAPRMTQSNVTNGTAALPSFNVTTQLNTTNGTALLNTTNGTVAYTDGFDNLTADTLFDCDRPLDVVFVLDGSGSVTLPNWANMVRFVADVAQGFAFGPTAALMSVVQFSSSVHLEIPLRRYFNRTAFGLAARAIEYRTGGTFTWLGIETAAAELMSDGRPSTQGGAKLMLVVTDGQSSNAGQTASAAQAARASGITLALVTIGSSVNPVESAAITDNDPALRFPLENWRGLEQSGELLANITSLVCSAPIFVPVTGGSNGTEQGATVDSSVACGSTTQLLFRSDTAAPVQVMTNVTGGQVVVCYSYRVRSPVPPGDGVTVLCDTLSAPRQYVLDSAALYPLNATLLPSGTLLVSSAPSTLYVSVSPTRTGSCSGNFSMAPSFCALQVLSNGTWAGGYDSADATAGLTTQLIGREGMPRCSSCPLGMRFMSSVQGSTWAGVCTTGGAFVSATPTASATASGTASATGSGSAAATASSRSSMSASSSAVSTPSASGTATATGTYMPSPSPTPSITPSPTPAPFDDRAGLVFPLTYKLPAGSPVLGLLASLHGEASVLGQAYAAHGAGSRMISGPNPRGIAATLAQGLGNATGAALSHLLSSLSAGPLASTTSLSPLIYLVLRQLNVTAGLQGGDVQPGTNTSYVFDRYGLQQASGARFGVTGTLLPSPGAAATGGRRALHAAGRTGPARLLQGSTTQPVLDGRVQLVLELVVHRDVVDPPGMGLFSPGSPSSLLPSNATVLQVEAAIQGALVRLLAGALAALRDLAVNQPADALAILLSNATSLLSSPLSLGPGELIPVLDWWEAVVLLPSRYAPGPPPAPQAEPDLLWLIPLVGGLYAAIVILAAAALVIPILRRKAARKAARERAEAEAALWEGEHANPLAKIRGQASGMDLPLGDYMEGDVDGSNPMARMRRPGGVGADYDYPVGSGGGGDGSIDGSNPMARMRRPGGVGADYDYPVGSGGGGDGNIDGSNPMARMRRPGGAGADYDYPVGSGGGDGSIDGSNPMARMRRPVGAGADYDYPVGSGGGDGSIDGSNPMARMRRPGGLGADYDYPVGSVGGGDGSIEGSNPMARMRPDRSHDDYWGQMGEGQAGMVLQGSNPMGQVRRPRPTVAVEESEDDLDDPLAILTLLARVLFAPVALPLVLVAAPFYAVYLGITSCRERAALTKQQASPADAEDMWPGGEGAQARLGAVPGRKAAREAGRAIGTHDHGYWPAGKGDVLSSSVQGSNPLAKDRKGLYLGKEGEGWPHAQGKEGEEEGRIEGSNPMARVRPDPNAKALAEYWPEQFSAGKGEAEAGGHASISGSNPLARPLDARKGVSGIDGYWPEYDKAGSKQGVGELDMQSNPLTARRMQALAAEKHQAAATSASPSEEGAGGVGSGAGGFHLAGLAERMTFGGKLPVAAAAVSRAESGRFEGVNPLAKTRSFAVASATHSRASVRFVAAPTVSGGQVRRIASSPSARSMGLQRVVSSRGFGTTLLTALEVALGIGGEGGHGGPVSSTQREGGQAGSRQSVKIEGVNPMHAGKEGPKEYADMPLWQATGKVGDDDHWEGSNELAVRVHGAVVGGGTSKGAPSAPPRVAAAKGKPSLVALGTKLVEQRAPKGGISRSTSSATVSMLSTIEPPARAPVLSGLFGAGNPLRPHEALPTVLPALTQDHDVGRGGAGGGAGGGGAHVAKDRPDMEERKRKGLSIEPHVQGKVAAARALFQKSVSVA